MRDRARTPADQALLVRVQQTVQAVQARFQGASPWTPVHFAVDDGVVTLIGRVPDASVEEQLEGVVQRVPGVTGIVDQLTIPGGGGSSVAGTEDQGLLLRIRQTVLPQIEVAGTPVPINFNVQQGVVTINGVLPNVAQKRQITALVRQVPGVVQVNNQVSVNASGVSGVLPSGVQAGTMPQNNIRSPGSSTSPGMMNNTLTPTGRTNAVGLPPGLQNQNPLPPGLENRTQLPPGLQTNQVPRQ